MALKKHGFDSVAWSRVFAPGMIFAEGWAKALSGADVPKAAMTPDRKRLIDRTVFLLAGTIVMSPGSVEVTERSIAHHVKVNLRFSKLRPSLKFDIGYRNGQHGGSDWEKGLWIDMVDI
ncbi:hypothetical protein Hypma_016270 [Hypsizygus marmoreus]|uniref:Uncharacterized protein n=1 Tax=Hypsizygus marmoreus TaxID=39966 RepID=A0A369J168_HYPMA|nr:hypothetical protein Hypma_016270 [Hypsizygus marmoreus]